MVLLLDDLHWADDATLALLQHVTPHLSQAPMLVVGTYRDVELDVGKPFEKALATLVRQKLAERLPLKRLPEEAVAELLAALGGGERVGETLEGGRLDDGGFLTLLGGSGGMALRQLGKNFGNVIRLQTVAEIRVDV